MPSSTITGRPGSSGRSGKRPHTATTMPPPNSTHPAAAARRGWWVISIGFSPAGFIMKATMKMAITVISTVIMNSRATPR